jgi:polysaccharide export outer membrane protein
MKPYAALAFALATAFAAAQSTTIQTAVGGASTLGPAPTAYYQAVPPVMADLNALLHAPLPNLPLHIDDTIAVNVFGVPAYSSSFRIARDGTVKLPLLPALPVAGLTTEQAAVEISDALKSADLVVDPAVTVSAADLSETVVTIDGEVPRPGVYPGLGHHTLGEYLAQAGGLLGSASTTITLVRPGMPPQAVPLDADPLHVGFSQVPIYARDRIVVSKVGTFYIVGALKQQGQYPLKGATPTTVAQAISMAGGAGFEALLNSTVIARTQGDKRVLLSVRAGDILHGKRADVFLQNDDIVLVPTSQLKAAVKAGGTGIIVSLATAAIYTH